ncbi:MAG: hypothetical protein HOC27_00285 [Phycisphaerae bacterium]|nr:hypothetical protein [Phycisphaerae bacterium]
MRNTLSLVLLFWVTFIYSANAEEKHPNAQVLGKLVYSDLSIDAEKMPAKNVIDSFKKDLDILMNVHWKTDTNDGLDPDTPITLKLTDKPALTIIEQVLEQMSENQSATWQLRHGVLEVGLKLPLAVRTSQLETYYIRDLLFKIHNFTAPELGTFDGNGEGGVEDDPTSEEEEVEKIINMITKFVEPELWEQNNGPCSITNYKNTLLIKAPDFVHRQIGGYLFEAEQPSEVRRRRVLYQGNKVNVIVDRLPLR